MLLQLPWESDLWWRTCSGLNQYHGIQYISPYLSSCRGLRALLQALVEVLVWVPLELLVEVLVEVPVEVLV